MLNFRILPKMGKIAIILLTLLIPSPVFADNLAEQDKRVYTDQDLEKYKGSPFSNTSPLHEQNDTFEGASTQDTSTTANDEISQIERQALEIEFNRIVSSMISCLETGDLEGALSFFHETSKDSYRPIFKIMIDSHTVKDAFEGYSGVALGSLYDHLAECEMIRNEKGTLYSYALRFIRNENGVWQIHNF